MESTAILEEEFCFRLALKFRLAVLEDKEEDLVDTWLRAVAEAGLTVLGEPELTGLRCCGEAGGVESLSSLVALELLHSRSSSLSCWQFSLSSPISSDIFSISPFNSSCSALKGWNFQ